MSQDADRRLDKQFDLLRSKLPPWGQRVLDWLRRPSAMLVRIPLGILLVLGGIFSILPFLGLWMLPLGLLLLAIDIPFLKGPITSVLLWFEVKWANWRRKRRAKRTS